MEKALVESSKVEILNPDWPGRQLPLMPGDLTQFLPQGLALGTPAIVRPWDDPLKVLTSPSFYDVDPPESHLFRAAPTQEPSGGVIYFDDHLEFSEIRTALEVMGATLQRSDYAVFAASADDPPNDRYSIRCGSCLAPRLPISLGAVKQAHFPISRSRSATSSHSSSTTSGQSGTTLPTRSVGVLRARSAATATGQRNRCASASWSRTPIGAYIGSGAAPGLSLSKGRNVRRYQIQSHPRSCSRRSG